MQYEGLITLSLLIIFLIVVLKNRVPVDIALISVMVALIATGVVSL